MMDNDLQKYLKEEPIARIISKRDKIHPILTYEYPLVVVMEEDLSSISNYQVWLMLWVNGKFVGNSIKLNFPIPEENLANIAERFMDEYLTYCDFSNLEKNYESNFVTKSHLNGWELEDELNKEYGKGTTYYSNYVKERRKKEYELIDSMISDVGEDESYSLNIIFSLIRILFKKENKKTIRKEIRKYIKQLF